MGGKYKKAEKFGQLNCQLGKNGPSFHPYLVTIPAPLFNALPTNAN
jgi:hypothetical protein